nr:hypothetical protein Iba_scaffold39297CG0040 [Ipomoea batatas]GMD64830.1 hypothetical protein Iba_chr12bCG28120 [Ipomoea batatas]GMD69769.1 hypothetical protein Iba_chr12dCG22240 [Ipomoea batatas]GME06883.1 hypothetical protein Iba_scaffold5504CG0020 [Ipomoea batatas]GME17136.1 hypothetical protein Iba_scaffold18402CG0050 [Ipomoea batatas]
MSLFGLNALHSQQTTTSDRIDLVVGMTIQLVMIEKWGGGLDIQMRDLMVDTLGVHLVGSKTGILVEVDLVILL